MKTEMNKDLDPEEISKLEPVEIPPLMAKCAAYQSALAAKLAEDLMNGTGEKKESARWITISEAVKITGLSKRWFYERKNLPFIKRLSRKSIRIDEIGLMKWIATRKG